MPGIINAVLVEWGDDVVGGFNWVESLTSISEHGRHEASLALDGVTDWNVAVDIVRAWIRPRLNPQTSYEATIAPLTGADLRVGDTLEILSEEDARAKAITWALVDDPELLVTPQINSLVEERELAAIRAMERQTAIHGGSSAASAPIWHTGSKLDSGELDSVAFTAWAWHGSFSGDDLTDWEPQKPKVPCRISKIECTATPTVVTDDTSFELYVNGVPFSPAITITLPWNESSVMEYVLNPQTLKPSDVLTMRLTERGGHENGSVEISGVKGA